MNLGCFFSGGKDSVYSLWHTMAIKDNRVSCLLCIHPNDDESLLFHYPNSRLVRDISNNIGIPLIEVRTKMSDLHHETKTLESLVKKAVEKYSIDGIITGAISSNFQMRIFKKACDKFNLSLIAPIWGINSEEYFKKLLDLDFKILITRVAAYGLDEKWIGTIIDKNNIIELEEKSKKFQFNLTFEGGEAETLVLDCPLYKQKIKIKSAIKHWDGIRGIFEIVDMDLVPKYNNAR